jgi:hypothetical protein
MSAPNTVKGEVSVKPPWWSSMIPTLKNPFSSNTPVDIQNKNKSIDEATKLLGECKILINNDAKKNPAPAPSQVGGGRKKKTKSVQKKQKKRKTSKRKTVGWFGL